MTATRLSLAILTTLVLFPLLAVAQENQPQPGAYCPNITQDLKRGDCDEGVVSQSCKRHVPNQQVTELQKFLASYYENFPDDYITGKFLSKTQQSVQMFQREQNLPAFGYVGPLTRAAIARVCGQTTPPPPANQSCTTPWGTTIQNNTTVIAYQSSSVPAGSQCMAETRICTNGNLSGSYLYQTCTVLTENLPPPQCTPLSPQTQTLSCPTGQTGSIIQTRTSTCPGPTWSAWTTTSNTCTTPTPPPPPPQTSQCVYGGVTYDTGYAAPNVPGGPEPGQYGWNNGYLYVCSSGAWQWKQCGWPNLTGPFPNSYPIPTKTGDHRFYFCS